MKYAMDVKVNLRPVFSNLVHSDYWEGPCRVGPEETGTPEYERRLGKEEIKQWYDELKANIDQTRCNRIFLYIADLSIFIYLVYTVFYGNARTFFSSNRFSK